jgi:hypothetical protein
LAASPDIRSGPDIEKFFRNNRLTVDRGEIFPLVFIPGKIMRKTIRAFISLFIILAASGLFFAACPTDLDETPDSPADTPDSPGDVPAPSPPSSAPVLTGAYRVSYSAGDGAVSVTFTFDMAVIITQPAGGWTITGNGTEVITAAPNLPLTPGVPVTIDLIAANSEYPDRTTAVSAELRPVGGIFARPATDTVYTIAYYDENGAAGLVSGTETSWFYVADEYFTNILNAVYMPNIPEALGLFHITIGAVPASDKIEIKGDDLPAAGTDNTTPIVINAGLPQGNSGLPNFSIPYRELGASGGDYAHIRIRVNRGASLVVLADNSGYESGGAGNPCPPGNFNRGAVEVMGGGALRNGAYEGFPLGTDPVIIARLGSRLAAGPETSFVPGGTGYVESRDRYFSGWLIGPAANSPRIEWGTGDQNGDFIEIREGKIAFSANVTVRKTLALTHSVWFVNGPALTIDAAEDSLEISGKKGLFAHANAGGYRFYGTASSSGGQNPGSPAAKIILKPGSALYRSFLADAAGDGETFIEAEGNRDISITNRGNTKDGPPLVFYVEGGTPNIFGYFNWKIPE